MRSAAVLLLAGVSLSAQAPKFSPAMLGYVWDSGTRGIHAISGVPGAASIGSEFTAGLDRGVVSGDRRFAIALHEETGWMLIRWGSGVDSQAISGIGAADLVALSPSGDSAVFYSRESGTARVLQGLPEQPTLAGEYNSPAALAHIAVADGGAVVAGAGEEGSLYVLSQSGARQVGGGGVYSAVSFLVGRPDLLASEPSTDQVILIRDAGGQAHMNVVAGASQGIADPGAVAASADNRRAVVVNRRGSLILSVGIDTGAVASVECDCRPERLERMTGDVFLVTGSLKSAATFIEDDASNPRLFAVIRGEQ